MKSENDKSFISGIWYAVQFIILSHGENTIAEDLIKQANLTKQQMIEEQKASGYENRTMMKFIRSLDI